MSTTPSKKTEISGSDIADDLEKLLEQVRKSAFKSLKEMPHLTRDNGTVRDAFCVRQLFQQEIKGADNQSQYIDITETDQLTASEWTSLMTALDSATLPYQAFQTTIGEKTFLIPELQFERLSRTKAMGLADLSLKHIAITDVLYTQLMKNLTAQTTEFDLKHFANTSFDENSAKLKAEIKRLSEQIQEALLLEMLKIAEEEKYIAVLNQVKNKIKENRQASAGSSPSLSRIVTMIAAKVVKEVEWQDKQKTFSKIELTKTLTLMSNVLDNPLDAKLADECHQQAQRFMSNPAKKRLGGTLLVLAGIITIAASAAVCIVSFGASTPISLGSVVLGVSMIHAGIAAASGVWGFGLSTLGTANFFNKKPIREGLDKLGDALKKPEQH